jgi:putative membrane protein
MRSAASVGKMGSLMLCAAAFAVAAGCKTSTASGTAGGGGADGGTATAPAGDGGGSVAHDVGQGAGTAAGNVTAGVEAAGQGIADAGAAAHGAAAGAATTAADAAREAASGARSGFESAMDGGSADGGGAASGAADAGANQSDGRTQLGDAQIAAIVVAANEMDIAAGQAAKRKSKNAEVKRFADEMIQDHTSANQQAAALTKKLGLTAAESDVSRAVRQGGKNNLARLKRLKGKSFDRAYAEHEVAYHQQILGTLDEKLIPGARNPELKSLLKTVRTVVAEHFDHAQELMESLSK